MTDPVPPEHPAERRETNPGELGAVREFFSKTSPNVVVIALLAVSTIGLVWIFQSTTSSSQLGVDQARSTLAVVFSAATVVLALCMILAAFLSADRTLGIKERFGLSMQVLTPLIGIMGTILGFYFGTPDQTVAPQPLVILDVLSPTGTQKSGESIPVTILTQGGKGPWTFDLDFGTAIPKIRKSASQPFLRETVKLPAVTASTAIGIKVTVSDTLGNSVEWQRQPKEWLTADPPK